MEFLNSNPLLLKHLVKKKYFQNEPLVCLDVGCSGGIDNAWKLYGEQLEAHGFDPQQKEIKRLIENEDHPGINYHACWIGVTDKEEIANWKASDNDVDSWWSRSSAAWALSTSVKPFQSNLIGEDHSKDKISLDDFIEKLKIDRGLKGGADFIKIDCDGGDLEAIMSCKKNLSSMGNVLGLLVECNFAGGNKARSNTFSNIDRVLKEYGYQPIAMVSHQYSRSALPRPFAMDLCAQTQFGPAAWGDVLFILDGVANNSVPEVKNNLTNVKLLKLVSLFDLFNLPDCAAEILIDYRDQLEKEVDVELMLDILVKEIAPGFPGYAAYMEAIEQNPLILFPGKKQKRDRKNKVFRKLRNFFVRN